MIPLRKDNQMKKRIALWLPLLTCLAFCPAILAQEKAQPQKPEQQAAPSSAPSTRDKNIQEYIELLRSNVRQQKAEIMGAVMQLDVDQAAKFWPIYSEYDAELTKLNNLRLANIEEYARNYDRMTDAKADDLIQKAFDYRKQRSELLAKYYGRVKASLGAIEAARFLQIEDQLLLIIDLQITSALPVVGQGS
jgi:flagellar biosynthesis chaperone FliJ